MANDIIAPEMMQLVQNLKPFLGPRGVTVTAALESVTNMLSTDNAVQARQNFSQMIVGKEAFNMAQAQTRQNPYIVFLVLVLLLLADGYPRREVPASNVLPISPAEKPEVEDIETDE